MILRKDGAGRRENEEAERERGCFCSREIETERCREKDRAVGKECTKGSEKESHFSFGGEIKTEGWR